MLTKIYYGWQKKLNKTSYNSVYQVRACPTGQMLTQIFCSAIAPQKTSDMPKRYLQFRA